MLYKMDQLFTRATLLNLNAAQKQFANVCYTDYLGVKGKGSPVTGLEWPRGFQEVNVPRFLDNGTGWW
jgi:hypothetical protein